MALRYVAVQPYTVIDGSYLFILGKESYVPEWNGSYTWSSFGGKPDCTVWPHQLKLAKQEAFREYEEESMGIFGESDSIGYHLDGLSITFFVYVEVDYSMIEVFSNIYQHFSKFVEKEGEMEKCEIGFFNLEELDDLNLRPEYRRDLPELLNKFMEIINGW